jgi:hypothetical protein
MDVDEGDDERGEDVPLDAWARLQALQRETGASWVVRDDLHVAAIGTDRTVELTLFGPKGRLSRTRPYQSTRRNVSTMRELALALWAACDLVEEVNPTWSSHLTEPRPATEFLQDDK